MLKNCFIFIQLTCLLVFSSTMAAQTEINYFSAEVPVKSQDSKERKSAASEGLREVLIRVSGSPGVLASGELDKKINGAISYVEQFQYLPLEDEALIKGGYRERISLKFSPSVVERLLYETRLPYWPVNRPKTVVWLAEDSPEEGRQLVNKNIPSPMVESLLRTAYQRGLPLVFPLLDLDDQLALSADDVWVFDEEKVKEASERYQADAILVGRYSTTSRGEIWATWQFFHAGTTRTYDNRSDLKDEDALVKLGDQALSPLADFLAARYSVVPTMETQARLVMQLSSIESFGDYYTALAYLDKMAAIADVDLVGIRQDTMLLYLDAESQVGKLMDVLALDGRMKPVVNEVSGPVPVWQQMPLGSFENPLNYQWLN